MKSLRWAFALTSLLFGVVVMLFFALAYPHHLHFQEQYQLFLFDYDYIWEVLSLPGGLADLIGRFLTQFFLYAWAGATILAAVLVSIQLLTYKVLQTTSKEMLTYVLSFIPALLFCCFFSDEYALMSAPIALIIVLGIFLLIRCIKSDNLRLGISVISIPITYMLAGAFVLPYAFLLCIFELQKEISLRSIVISCILALTAVVTPLAWHQFVHLSLAQLYAGPHYYRNPEETPQWAWYAMCVVPLLMMLPKRIKQWCSRRGTTVFLFAWVVLMSIGGVVFNSLQSQQKEDTMAYDFMARHALWNRIIQKAQDRAPKNQVSVVALNLALAERGLLTEGMFEFPQNGINGLLPNFATDCFSPLVTAEAFYRLGLINTAQRFVFEAQEAIPDFQKSARCYKRLAETNLINGAYDVAKKYLIALRKTLFYRSWAIETLDLLSKNDAVEAHPEYGNLRKMRCTQDYFFGGNTLHQILARQLQSNPQNRKAFEYLEAACLLAKDVEKAVNYYSLGGNLGYKTIPNAIQQAMLLNWSQNHKMSDPIPAYFQENLVQGFKNFHMTLQASNGNPESVQRSFGKTYWSYYYFHK